MSTGAAVAALALWIVGVLCMAVTLVLVARTAWRAWRSPLDELPHPRVFGWLALLVLIEAACMEFAGRLVGG